MTASCPGRAHVPSAWRLFAVAVLVGWTLGFAPAPVVAKELVPVTLTAGFSPAALLRSNHNDAEAAFKAFAEFRSRELGYQVTVKTRSFPDTATFHAALARDELNFAVLDSFDFVAEHRHHDLAPVFIPAVKGLTGRKYLLLVRRGSGLRTLADLRGKSVVEFQAPDLGIGRIWLQNLLLTRGLGTPEEFFRATEYVTKPTAAVLPVFFGKQDACLVDELGFQLMQELNPQVGTAMLAVETSPRLVGNVVCISEKTWSSPAYRQALIDGLRDLHRTAAGRQVLALFKIDRMLPYDDAQLQTVRELWTAQVNLQAKDRP